MNSKPQQKQTLDKNVKQDHWPLTITLSIGYDSKIKQLCQKHVNRAIKQCFQMCKYVTQQLQLKDSSHIRKRKKI